MDTGGSQVDRERFVWPPRPVEVLAPEEPRVARRAVILTSDPAPAPATWPGPQPRAPELTALQQAVRQVERVWLGLITPPLPERMAEMGWEPDRPEMYCGRCGSSVGPGEAVEAACSVCRGSRLPWDRLVRLGEFDGLLRDIVHEVKFTRWRRLGDDLGRLLGRAVGEAITAARIPRPLVVVVPIGCSWRRRMARGIDHALVLARGVSAAADVELVPALIREHRPTQTDLPRSRRRSNVAGSIRVKPWMARYLAGKTVVLVDDVTTTRATLAAASRGIWAGVRDFARTRPDDSLEKRTRVWAAVAGVTQAEAGTARKMQGLASENGPRAGSAG